MSRRASRGIDLGLSDGGRSASGDGGRSGGDGRSGGRSGGGQPPAGSEELEHRGVRWQRAGPALLYWYNEGYGRWVLWSPGQDAPPVPPGWAPGQPTPTKDGEGSAAGGRAAARRVPNEGGAEGRKGTQSAEARRPLPKAGEPPPGAAKAGKAVGGSAGRAAASQSVAGRSAASQSATDRPSRAERTPAADHSESATGAAQERPGLLRYLPDNAMAGRKSMTSPYRLVPILIVLAIVVIAVYQATRPPSHATRADIEAAQALDGRCLAREAGGSASYSATPVNCDVNRAAVKVVAVVLAGKRASCPRGSLVAQVAKPGVVGEPFECLKTLRRSG